MSKQSSDDKIIEISIAVREVLDSYTDKADMAEIMTAGIAGASGFCAELIIRNGGIADADDIKRKTMHHCFARVQDHFEEYLDMCAQNPGRVGPKLSVVKETE